MNTPSSRLTRFLCPDPVLFWAYALPVLYWAYLTLTANFILVFDSEEYCELGRLFSGGHWLHFFQTGPHREPLYPLLVAMSMSTGKLLGIPYTFLLKIFSFGLLLATMIIIQKILKMLNANRWIQAAAIAYTGLSPILVNSALCLYSEIAAVPWLVGSVWLSIHYLRCLEGRSKSFTPAYGLGACLLAFTLVKGMGELLAPLFLGWLLFRAWQRSKLKASTFLHRSKTPVLAVLLVFYLPLLGYKALNYAFNRHFAVTNRSTMALYGNLNLRAQSPLTIKNVLSHLAAVPVSYDLCSRFFGQQCRHWSMSSSDETFLTRRDELNRQGLTAVQKDRIFTQGILSALFMHPLNQTVYLVQEGMKMFFWETSQGAFVVYPPWLDRLFNLPWVVVLMSLGTGTFWMAGYMAAWTMRENEVVLTTLVLTTLLIVLYSFVNIIHRYAITSAPLMILLNAGCLSLLAAKVSALFASKPR